MEYFQTFIDGIGLTKMTIADTIMLIVSLVLMYLAIVKKCEPFLLVPLSFGMMIANIPLAGLDAYTGPSIKDGITEPGGLIYYLYQGMKLSIWPPLIFLCLGAMTDFGPLIARPSSAIIGIGGQLGIFVAFGLALLFNFDNGTAASIGIIGSSDGPTTIYTVIRLAPDMLAPVAIAAYSYMALIPIIQPPIMRLLTTQKERVIVMPTPQDVSKRKRVIFPIAMTLATLLIVPAAGPLIAMLMLGNLIKEAGVVDRFLPTLQKPLLNIFTMLIGISVGATAIGEKFLQPTTLIIICLGLIAFAFGTAGGVLMAKLLNVISGGKVNPLIGNSGVSAMPMAARVSQKLGQQYNPQNHLMMHAMGPIVASTLGSAIVAGIFITIFRGG
ncbi:MAG: sodium ion-translocating decarboxylase subunit beta [Fibromonadales bacterium]|nr:sodium ion-translocating decarboxylase subunit beta [Fibromonadales bacterium]